MLDEFEDGRGARLEVTDDLGLADGLAELLLDVDERLQSAVAEENGFCHHFFGHDRGAGLDHHDRVAGAGHDEVDIGVLEVADGGVDHELAVDAADPHGADRAHERDRADRERAGRGKRAEDVGLVLLVRREDRDHDLDVVLVALGEERPDRSVGQAASQDGLLGRPRFALDEAARDLARGVHALFELNCEGKEVQAGARVGPVGRSQQHGVAELDGDRAAGQQGDFAGLDDQGATGELRLDSMRHGV